MAPPTIGREPGALDNWTDPQQLVAALEQLSRSMGQAGMRPDEALGTLGASAQKFGSDLLGLPQALTQLPGVVADQGVGPVMDAIGSSLSDSYGSPERMATKVTTDPVGAAFDVPGDPTDALSAVMKMKGVAPLAASLFIPGAPAVDKRLWEVIRHAPHRGPSEYEFIPEVIDRIQRAILAGQARGANWEYDLPKLLAAANNDPVELEKILLMHGATTPNTDFIRSTAEGTIANRHRLLGRPLDEGVMQREGITQAGAKFPNIRRALARTPQERQALIDAGMVRPQDIGREYALGSGLRGPKVNAMGRYNVNVLYPDQPAAIGDLHALRVYGSPLKKPDIESELPGLRHVVYKAEGLGGRGKSLHEEALARRHESAVLNALRQIYPGVPDTQLAKLYADMWDGGRAFANLPHQEGFGGLMELSGQLRPGALMDPEAQADAINLLLRMADTEGPKRLGTVK
jgi:hypothetical protein